MSVQLSTPTPSDQLAARDVALCRATLYSALALGFQAPTEETRLRLASARAVAALALAAKRIDAGGDAVLAALIPALAEGRSELAHLIASHRRLFGHTVRGEVPAYETEYGDEALFQQPQELSDLGGFMQAFGLRLRPDAHERVDHVSCECEFAAFLAFKEAYARSNGDSEMFAATHRATALFLRDHLGRFAPAFTRLLRRADPDSFYGRLAELLAALVASDCRRFAVPVGSELLSLRPDPTTNAPMGCDPESQGCGAGACPT
jgi:DMSO reductase family type II enzyme chaperone